MKLIKKIFKVVKRQLPIPFHIQIVMTENEKRLLIKYIQKSNHHLEFGMGGSTFLSLYYSRSFVYTVDSSNDWIIKIKNHYYSIWNKKRLCICYADIGPTKEWGYPTLQHDERFKNYSSAVFEIIGSQIIDTVLIDGRFRVACAINSIIMLNEQPPIIMIHDFWQRPQYNILLKYLELIDSIDSLVVFKIKEGINLTDLHTDYDKYKYIPD